MKDCQCNRKNSFKAGQVHFAGGLTLWNFVSRRFSKPALLGGSSVTQVKLNCLFKAIPPGMTVFRCREQAVRTNHFLG